MNSDSILCAIVRAGHLKSKDQTNKEDGHPKVRKQQSTLRKARISPARIPEITTCSRRGMTQHLNTAKKHSLRNVMVTCVSSGVSSGLIAGLYLVALDWSKVMEIGVAFHVYQPPLDIFC